MFNTFLQRAQSIARARSFLCLPLPTPISLICSSRSSSSSRMLSSPAAAALGMQRPGQGACSLRQRVSSLAGISRSYPRQQASPARSSSHPSILQQQRSKARWHTIAEAGGGSGSGGGGSAGGSKGYSSGGSGGEDDGLWAAYNRLLVSNPLFVKAVTTAVLSALGNVVCQVFVEKQPALDWRRFSIFTALGFLWVAPCLHFWFGTLNRLVTAPGNTGALLRMACDQLGFAPLFIGSMIGILTALDGKPDKIVDTIRADLPSAIQANWALWVPAQFVNFRFVPGEYQVLFANVVALAWNIYFSYATRPKTKAAATA